MIAGEDLEIVRKSRSVLPPLTVDEFVLRYIYVSKGKLVYDTELPPMHAIMTYDEFVLHTAAASIEEIGARGGIVRTPLAKIWVSDSRRQTAIGAAYMPESPEHNILTRHGVPVVNTFYFPYHDEEYKDTVTPPALFMSHIEYLFGEDVETALDFLAHIIQKPSERPSFVPYSIAVKHGTGRGWIDRLMHELIGTWNCSAAKIENLVNASSGGFNNFYDDTIWCNVGEIKVEAGKRFEVDDKLRDVLTDKMMLINPKYGKQAFKPVYARTFLCSNHPDGLAIPNEDRRIWATRVNGEPKAREDYDRLYDELKNPAFISKIFYSLKNRDISAFSASGRAPMTQTKREVIDLHRSEPDEAIAHLHEAIGERWQSQWHPALITTDQLYSFLGARDERAQSRYRAVLKGNYPLYLANDGDGRIKWQGKPVKVWILKDVERWRKATRREVRDELDRVQRIWDESKAPFEEIELEDLI